MKLCGYIRKLRSSQPTQTLKPMSVKLPEEIQQHVLGNVYAFTTVSEEKQMFSEARELINCGMDYYEWMQYLHDEIQKYEYKTSTKYWCNGVKLMKDSGDGSYTEVK